MTHSFSIKVENIGKRYRLGVIGRSTLAEELQYWICKTTGRNPASTLGPVGNEAPLRPPSRLRAQMDPEHPGAFWSLRHVDFCMHPGEIVGIVGANGAGKSTLLKILARITEPTEGRALISGRMSSLLEVGTGFHPELTGRENVFVNGAILGMSEPETRDKFDAIVDFAEVSDFIETPVKRYSSGMRTRLAFAVAAHLEPEVLLLDEVLSVGDAAFQRKCAAKMKELAGQGRTVLIVSHRFSTISHMCSRCLWLHQGRLAMDDTTDAVLTRYLGATSAEGGEKLWDGGLKPPRIPGMTLYSLRIRNAGGEVTAAWTDSESVTFEIEYALASDLADFSLGVELSSEQGVPIADAFPPPNMEAARQGYHQLRAKLHSGALTPGPIMLSVLVRVPEQVQSLTIGKTLKAEIIASQGSHPHRGRVHLPIQWENKHTGPCP